MELHNTMEDVVVKKVEEIFDSIIKEGNKDNICTCGQCRIDTACYVLNRTPPYYLISHRGIARVQQVTIEQQQKDADIAVLIYEGIQRVNHNQRDDVSHTGQQAASGATDGDPVFNIPTIMGRLFSGVNFAPVSDVQIELLRDNVLVPMKDPNWQNPYSLVSSTEGTYTFWPAPVSAGSADERRVFEYLLRIQSPEYETLNHILKIPVISEFHSANSFMLERTFKLPDLYMFPPGEAEKNGYLD